MTAEEDEESGENPLQRQTEQPVNLTELSLTVPHPSCSRLHGETTVPAAPALGFGVGFLTVRDGRGSGLIAHTVKRQRDPVETKRPEAA